MTNLGNSIERLTFVMQRFSKVSFRITTSRDSYGSSSYHFIHDDDTIDRRVPKIPQILIEQLDFKKVTTLGVLAILVRESID